MRSASSTWRALAAPSTPVHTTSTAVSVGRPPIFSEMPMATGAVTDFGASEAMVALLAPSAQPTPLAVTVAASVPTTSAPAMGSHRRLTRASCSNSGTDRATVAGPSRKCTNCAPSK
ncbi:hypothetical protein D9M69_621460 [compost metagenome]